MLGTLLERYRQAIILALSIFILIGSGVSLGVGITEVRREPEAIHSSGLEKADPGQVLNSQEEIVEFPLNINTATAVQLEALPGIGPTKAQAIVEYRTQNGPFSSLAEIQNVSGIGPKTYEQIRSKIFVK